MEFGMAHSSRFQHNNTCNLINSLDGGWSTLNFIREGAVPFAVWSRATVNHQRRSAGSGVAQAREELIGACDVAGDLRAQFFGAAEFLFFAKALPESHFHAFGCLGQLGVEQMRFDAERGTVERWALTDIGDRAVTPRFSFEARARDVDAPSGKQFLFRGEVQGREGEAASRPRAADHFTRESKRPAQKTRGVGHVALGDFPANDGAGDHLSAIDDRENDHNVESVFCTERGQQFHVARLLMPEAKIFSDENGLYVQVTEKNLLHE